MRAPFIVLEGLDGAGTTTQTARLADALRATHEVHQTREPSDGPIGTMIRQALAKRLTLPTGDRLTPETLALLFAADRMDHLAAEIDRLRNRGVWIICDRYVLSSLAYQGQEVDPAFVAAINSKAPAPDLTLFLKVSPEVALTRRKGRALGDDLFEALETQRRVAAAYDSAVSVHSSAHRIVVIDGEQPVDAVTRECVDWARGTVVPFG